MDHPFKTLFGGLLGGIGILVMTCSGLCSLAVAAFSLAGNDLAMVARMILIIAVCGGVPFAIGFGLLALGRALVRGGRAADDAAD